jgi:hypothetical protein
MDRIQLLAAETFRYSYANYDNHLGVNVRFDRLMPDTVRLLERATAEGWPLKKIAKEMDSETEAAANLLESFKQAKQIVDAENPAEAFRAGVRFSIQDAISAGLRDEKSIETLVTQICYRAADLGYLLKQEGTSLAKYSERLRREPDVEYSDGDFDREKEE